MRKMGAYLLLDTIFLEGLDELLGEVYACVRFVEPTPHDVSILMPRAEKNENLLDEIERDVLKLAALPPVHCDPQERHIVRGGPPIYAKVDLAREGLDPKRA